MKKIINAECSSAERIALPKGSDNKKIRQAFSESTGIEVPILRDGRYDTKSQGKTFFWLKANDIPARVNEKTVDVGVCGTDCLFEYEDWAKLTAVRLGEPVCRFSVLTADRLAESFGNFMEGERRYLVPTLWLPTSKPRLLEKVSQDLDYPFRPMDIKISGGVEAYVRLIGAPAVADIVETGKTARENGLTEVLKLCDIEPVLLS